METRPASGGRISWISRDGALLKAQPTSRWTCEISSEIENEASERSGVSDREER
jgi:hypothetical protein